MDLLSKMETFVRVVEAGRLSAAAKQLRISSAAVSRQLAALEGEVGVPLVTRTTRRMSVTEAGRQYYERCLGILRAVDEAQAVGRKRGLEGVLRLSVPITLGMESVLPKLHPLMVRHPALSLDIQLDDRLIDVFLDDVDLAIRVSATPPLSTEIVAMRLSAWSRVLVAAPSYLKRRGTPRTPEALATHDALSQRAGGGADTWDLVSGPSRTRVHLKVRWSSNSGYLLRDCATRGLGIALLPRWLVAERLAEGTLRQLLPGWCSELMVVHALYRTAHRREQRLKILVEHLKAEYAAEARRQPD